MLAVLRVTTKPVRTGIGVAFLKRRWRWRPSKEEVIQQVDRVGDVHPPGIICVGGVDATRLGPAKEEPIEAMALTGIEPLVLS